MSFGSVIKIAFKAIGKYAIENPAKTAAIVGTTFGTVGAAVGTGNAIVAKNTNKKANAIYNAAIQKNDKSEEEVRVVLYGLAEKQLQAASLFAEFADLIEKIQQRPEGLFQGECFATIPRYNAEDFKTLSNDARIVLDTLGGAALGIATGAAAVGFQIAALGFSAFAAGTVLLFKGIGLRKKAAENFQRAEAIKQEVDAIVCFHSLLMEAAGQIAQSIDRILPQYESHLSKMREIVSRSTDWNDYSELEEIIIENSIRLACCLNGLCIIHLTRETENENVVVDSERVILLQEESQKILSIIGSSYKHGFDNVATD